MTTGRINQVTATMICNLIAYALSTLTFCQALISMFSLSHHFPKRPPLIQFFIKNEESNLLFLLISLKVYTVDWSFMAHSMINTTITLF